MAVIQKLIIKNNDMDIDKKYFLWEEKLWKKYKELFPNATYTITDGVVSPKDYSNASFKVMVLNREAYDEDSNSYSLNLDGILGDITSGKKVFEKQLNLRTRLKEYLATINYLSTHNFKATEQELRAYVDKISEEEFNKELLKCAYVNVKKSDGLKSSNRNNLRVYAEKGIDILKEQFSFINPTIIMAGDVCDDVLDSLMDWEEGGLYNFEGSHAIKVYQLRIGNQLFPYFDMYHPSRTQCYMENDESHRMADLFVELSNAIQQIAKENPGFWEQRMKLPCFDK